jgi:signal transduction histidine kinase
VKSKELNRFLAPKFLLPAVLIVASCAAVFGVWLWMRQSSEVAFDAAHSTWVPYGGDWERKGDSIESNSDERDAKLMGGSLGWKDYSVDVDLALLGAYGGAGVIVRGHGAENGIAAYTGFIAGLGSVDNTLLLARNDFGMEGYRNTPLPSVIQLGRFYHLRIVIAGCKFAARVDLPEGGSVREGVDLTQCEHSGQIGLQSYQSPAIWRNLQVRPATEADVTALMQGVPLCSAKAGNLHALTWQNVTETIKREAASHALEGSPTPISALALSFHSPAKQESVRGTVTLLSPMTYVEDATGAVMIRQRNASPLAIGDDVEVTGTPVRDAGQMTIEDARVRVLASSTPLAPRMIAADQAATGAADGQFIFLDGVVRATWKDAGREVLEMESNGVVFRAISALNRYDRDLSSLRPGSELILSGVIRSDVTLAGDSAFAVLLSPAQDAVRVVHEASWWTATNIAVFSAALICLTILSLLGYGRVREFWLMYVVKERELLANDLHDTIAQCFAGIGFQLRAVEVELSTGNGCGQQLERAQAMLQESHQELRQSITSLRVQIGSSDQLASALESIALRLVQGGQVDVQCICEGSARKLAPRVADCFFRVGQEAISNAIQHANASKLRISIVVQARWIALMVMDNGVGLNGSAQNAGYGLSGMRRRAETIGAVFTIDSGNGGTTVLLRSQLVPHTDPVFRALRSRLTSGRRTAA